MSSEMGQPENQSSRWRGGEDGMDLAGQQPEPGQRSGGVGASGMTGSDTRVSWEVSRNGAGKLQTHEQAGAPGKAASVSGDGRVLRSSGDPKERQTCGEQRGGACIKADQRSEEPGDGWEEGAYLFNRIGTPPKVQKLQRTLYRKAKAEPGCRFYSLYGEICRDDVLETAMRAVCANGGTPGLDGVCIVELSRDDQKWKAYREQLQAELRSKTYQPSPVLRKYIPKGDGSGKMRPLGIPVVKDRIAQAAVAMVLGAIFEADFHSRSYAYRPQRNAHQAVAEIKEGLRTGRTLVIDADLSGYFDSIPHGKLLELAAKRVSDGQILKLIKAWLKAPIVEVDPKSGKRKVTPNDRGTPQGGVISPLLANLYLSNLDKGVNDKCELKPWMIRYADDFVILCFRSQGAELVERLKKWLKARELKLNEEKTRLLDLREGGAFKFLGFSIGQRRGLKGKHNYFHVEPHAASCKKLRANLRKKLNRGTMKEDPREVIAGVNRSVKGWVKYFSFGNYRNVLGKVEAAIYQRTARWLWRRHNRKKALWKHYTKERLRKEYGLWMPCMAPTKG